MSELINNSDRRKSILKQLILDLHSGVDADIVKEQVQKMLKKIPYGEVVEVEQELIANGLPVEEVMKLCDIHSTVLQGTIDLTNFKKKEAGHPVEVFIDENRAIEETINDIKQVLSSQMNEATFKDNQIRLLTLFNTLGDIDKHYKRKEYLLFPFLEKYGITGPPKVMWGKHDEIRDFLNSSIEALRNCEDADDIVSITAPLLIPCVEQIADMIMKEEHILFPMSSERLTELEWYEIYKQTMDYGYCIVAPKEEWKPKIAQTAALEQEKAESNTVRLPSGKLNYDEILGILNTVPFDMTFVDKDDKVKYFTEGAERIFARSRAILHRDVRLCHPPSSVHIVDKIIEDFKTGKQDRAPFWINMHGKFIHIEYFAVRDTNGNYLGTLEVSQDATALRALEGEQRLLSYAKRGENE